MKKSFYYLYQYTQAGGEFGEVDFTTTSIENLIEFIYFHVRVSPWHCFFYGVFAKISVIEDGELVQTINILEGSSIKIAQLNVVFKYVKDDKDFNNINYSQNAYDSDSFLPR